MTEGEALRKGVEIPHKQLGEDKIKGGCLKIDEGILLLERLGGTQKVWEYLISDAGKRQKVLGLRKKLNQPLELKRLSKDIPVPLEPELYIAELQKVEVTAKLQDMGKSNEGNVLVNDIALFGKDISKLKDPFREKFRKAASLFYGSMIKMNKKWAPIPVGSVEERDNTTQAKLMIGLYPYNRLANIYAKNGGIPISRKIYELLDHIFVDGLPYFLEDYRKLYTPILPEHFVKAKDLDAGEKHWKKYFEGLIFKHTSDTTIAGYFREILERMFTDSHTLQKALANKVFKIPTTMPWEKESNKTTQKELAQKILVYMLEDPQGRYGYMSKHRVGHAVDIASNYIYFKDLKEYFDNNKNLGLSYDDKYNSIPDSRTGEKKPSHLHVGLKS